MSLGAADNGLGKPYLGVSSTLRLMVDGVEKELVGFHRLDRNPIELEKEKEDEDCD